MSAKYPGRTALTTAELELQFMWQQAELEFSRLTRKNLRADQGKRLEDVLRELEEKYQPQPGSARESSTSNKNKIRDTISKVLNCIQLLGGLVADGASVVFGPATLCFNAISFLIDVPNKIADVYEGIGNLFEEVSHFLALFKIYENFSELDPDLRDGTHKLMMSVVRICGLSIKIIEGGVLHHIKIGAKVAFLKDDSGVRAELVEFKALIDKQSHVTEAVTLQHVLSNEDKLAEALRRQYESAEKIGNIEVGVKTLVADLSDRKLQRITSERVDTMAKMLGMTEEPAQEARRAIQRMKDNRLKGSAQWLMEMQEYKEWKTDTDQLPLLLLCGEPKTGKSYLLAAIDEDLRDQDPTVAIAYYKFSGHDAKSNKEKNRDDVVSALKSMALQLAGQYKTYSKEMAALKDDFKPPDPGKELFEKQWWDKLQLSKYAQMKEEAHIVLLFDGVDELSDSNTTKFFKLVKAVRDEGQAIAKARLRFLVTGKVKTFQNTRQYTTPAGTIPTSDYNEPDIMLYLEQELEGDDVLQGGHVEMMDLLKSIRKTLPTKAQGSFSAVQQKLERVREAVESDAYLDDVETILAEDTAEDVDKLAHKVIGDLNASLNAHDIEQLNELLKWTIFGYTYFSVDELRAALFLSSGRAPLQAFEKKLKNKYMRVLHLEGGTVRVDWDISKLFAGSDRGIPGREAALDIDAAKITMTISINQADTPTVQRFLWDLTERVGIGRFDFTPLKTGNDGKGVIECEEARAHYHLAAHLLKLLCDDPDERTKPLVYYALLYLPLHLDSVREALGEKKLGNLERRTIAKRLVDLLSDVEGMEKFWDTSDDIHESWLSNDAVFTIQSWLDDFKTREVLEPRERRWIRQYASRADGRGGFYRPMTIMVARHWLQDSAWRARQSFSWVDRFIALQKTKVMKSRSSSVSSGSSSSSGSSKSGGSEGSKADEDEAADVERIASAATWAQEALGIKEESLNSLWYERLGDTCYAFSEYAAARDRFEKAKNLPDTRWTANQGWAVATFELGMADNSEELKMLACDEMETVLTVLRGLFKSGSASDVECRMLVENVKQLASWQKGLNQLDKTLALYQEALEVDPYEHGTHCDLLQLLYKQNKLEDARKSLLGSPGQDVTTGVRDRDTSIFVSLLQYLAETEDDEGHLGVMNIIVILAGADQTFSQFTLEALQSAIVDARKNNNTVGEGILLLYQGIILARGSADNNRIQQAARSWEDCMSLYLTFQYHLMRTQDYAARYMTQYYFNQSINQSRQVSLQGGDDEHEQHFSKLLRISRQSANWSHSFKPDSYLAACYVQQGKLDKARALFMDDMIMALEILSDQDPDNDYYGYKYLANILMHVGDDLNALSAWSLLGPSDLFRSKEEDGHSESEGAKESEPEPEPESVEDTRSISEGQHEHQREGPLTYRCDGGCGHYWTYASDMYICRFCPDTQFTGDCLEKVRTGKLERFICHPVHSWLHVPVWSDEEALAVGQGRVKVRGSLVDGQRVGGEVVDIKDWLDELREQWNVPSL